MKSASVLYFPGCTNERAKRSASKRRTDADALDAGLGQLLDAERGARHAHDDVDRFVDSGANRPDRLEIVEAWSVENVRACLRKGLQPFERVIQIAPAPEEVLAAGREDEIVRQPATSLDRRRDPFDRKIERENRIGLTVAV